MVPFFFADVVFRGLSVRVRAATERHVYMCVCVVSCISVFLWSRSSPSNSVRVVLLSAVFFFFAVAVYEDNISASVLASCFSNIH